MNEEQLKLFNRANKILTEKKETGYKMNSLAKEKAKIFEVGKDTLIRVKDYQHYRGNGWVDGDPLKKDPDIPCRFPDRVSPIFMKLVDLYNDLSKTGRLEDLEPYLKSLKEKGLTIVSTLPVADRREDLDETVNELDGLQGKICSLANAIRDDIKPRAEEMKIVPKRDFDEVLELYHNKFKGKDTEDKANKMITNNSMTISAVSVVENENTEMSEEE